MFKVWLLLFVLVLQFQISVTEVFLKTDLDYRFRTTEGGIEIPNCSIEKCNEDYWCNLFIEDTGSCYYGMPESIQPNNGDKMVGYLKDRKSKNCPSPFTLDPSSAHSYFLDPCTCSSLWKGKYDLQLYEHGSSDFVYMWGYTFKTPREYGNLKIERDIISTDPCKVTLRSADNREYAYEVVSDEETKQETVFDPMNPKAPFQFTCDGEYGKLQSGTLFTKVSMKDLDAVAY